MNLDFRDEVLQTCLNDIISALLPHEKYSPTDFSVLYPVLKSVLDTDSAKGLYYLFYDIFDRYSSLLSALPKGKFKIFITKKRFTDYLETNLPDLILEPSLDIVSIMAQEGKTADITIPTHQQEVMKVVYSKAIDLYEQCYKLGKSYDDAMSRIIDLRSIVKANLIEVGFSYQRTIMSTGLKQGKELLRGPSGWLTYTQNLTREIAELDTESDGDLECNELGLVNGLMEHTEELLEPLANYGVPLLDDYTPMLKHRLVVLVARENTGKTQVCIDLIAKLIRAGVKPFFACGESPKSLMFNCIVSSYIYQEYGLFFESQHLTGEGYNLLNNEEKQIVNTAKARISCSGLVISNNLSYDTVVPKIQHYYNKGCEAFFIDHTQSLRGRNGRRIGDLVTGLALDCRELKNSLPIYICLASQPSVVLKDLLQKDQTKDMQQSPTAQSATPSQEADELFILNETEYLKTQGLLAWITYKRRGAPRPKTFYIMKHFNVSAFEYDAKYQGVESIDKGTLNNLIGLSPDLDADDDADSADNADTGGDFEI